jgi:hypothetical protein
MLVRRFGLLVLLALIVVASAHAGGAGPQSVVGVGANHHARQIRLGSTVAALLYRGKPTTAPRTGYVRLYPIFFGLPGLPGRFFPATGALCFDPPGGSCTTLPTRARQMLSPLDRLPLRIDSPTTVRALYHGRTRLRLPNFAVAIELAFERGGHRAALPGSTTPLTLTWKGPDRDEMPAKVRIGRRRGLYSRGLLYPLSAGSVTYLRANLGS